MFKQTALVTLADASAVDRIRAMMGEVGGATRNAIGTGLPGGFHGGDLVWHLHFADQAVWADSGAFERLDAIAANAGVGHIDAIAYRPDPVRAVQPALADGVYRALFVHVEPTATPAQTAQWLAEIRAMPDHIPEIRNAATGIVVRARGARPWTHVWEQEFAALADLRGPYMASPYHWGHVDRWFDPEMPDRIVDLRICHSASTLPYSVIRDY
jgi:hypothetical protein